jgi:hypothetical protein
VNDDLDVGKAFHDRAGCARVIEMNVGEEEMANVFETDPFPRQLRRKVIDGSFGSGIDQRHAGRTVKDGGRNNLGPAEKCEINVVEAGSESGHP